MALRARIFQKPLSLLVLSFTGLFLVLATGLIFYRYIRKQTENPYFIGIIFTPSELPNGQLSFFKELIGHKIQEMNDAGGIDGRPIEPLFLDDQNDTIKLKKLVEQTSRNPNLIAYVGCKGPARPLVIGPILQKNNIPLIGQYVFTHLTQKYKNMYTASVSTNDVRTVTRELLREKAHRIGILTESGNRNSIMVRDLVLEVIQENPDLKINLQKEIPKGYDFNNQQGYDLLDSLNNQTDFLVVNEGPQNWRGLVAALAAAKFDQPVFNLTTDFQQFDNAIPGYQANEIYAINTFGIPGAQNTKLLEHLLKYQVKPDQSPQGKLALNATARIADQLGWIQDAALDKSLPPGLPIRARINAGLKKYINGGRIYRGWLTDWFFSPEHGYGGRPMLAWKPRDFEMQLLAPFQVLGTDTFVQRGQVLYTNLNLESIEQVNELDASFYATFYLEINSAQNINFKDLDFINAARNEINHEALIESKLIRSMKDSIGQKFYNNLYKISGKFFFEPDLKTYPLDVQKFPISVQASNPGQVFLIQPSQKNLRDTIFESEGWNYQNQYLGFDQEIISTTGSFYGQAKNLPYYKFSYVYIMKRAHIDFFLKTLVPLMTIVIITYFSVFIPPREFEALAAVQVTGLLSTIALYFSTYKPAMQYATLADKMFIFMYIMITTLIGTSILIYIAHHKNSVITRFMRLYQRYLFPLIVLGFTVYVRWF